MLYQFIVVVFAYMLAAVFSTSVSMTLTATVWTQAGTYAILAFWWVVSMFVTAPLVATILFCWAVFMGAIIIVGATISGWFPR